LHLVYPLVQGIQFAFFRPNNKLRDWFGKYTINEKPSRNATNKCGSDTGSAWPRSGVSGRHRDAALHSDDAAPREFSCPRILKFPWLPWLPWFPWFPWLTHPYASANVTPPAGLAPPLTPGGGNLASPGGRRAGATLPPPFAPVFGGFSVHLLADFIIGPLAQPVGIIHNFAPGLNI